MNPEPGRPGGGRRRPPPQPVEVVSVSRVAPRLISVVVGGADLSRFAQAPPTAHIKVFLPAPGQAAPTLPTVTPDGDRVWPADEPRPTVRTYTPRSYDPTAGTLEVQFVLHGEGPAAAWARRAQPGDQLAIGGPGGRFTPDLSVPHWWIAGDESALPAVGTLLDVLPPTARATVHLEVDDPADEIPLPSAAAVEVTWHHRGSTSDALAAAAASAAVGPDTQFWVAGEASAVRVIRRDLLSRGLPAGSLVTRGYWRRGVADHPDHDYADD